MNSEEDSATINPLDRRVAPRFNSVFPVGMEFAGQRFCQSKAINVSVTGMKVVVDQSVGKGVPINLTLCLDEDNLVELQGTTVWQEQLGTMGTHIVGLHFADGQAPSRKDLRAWLRTKGVAA